MAVSSSSWMDAMPTVVAPFMASGGASPAPSWTPAASSQGYVPTIDVGGTSSATMGQPGSQFAPSSVNAKGFTETTPLPALPSNIAPGPDDARVVAPAPKASFKASSWMDAMPTVQTPLQQMTTNQQTQTGGKLSGPLANLGAGTSEGVANVIGGLADLPADAVNLGIKGLNAATGLKVPQIPTTVPQMIESAEGAIGADPRNVVPSDDVDRLARAGGQGAAGTLLPWGMAGALPELGGIAGAAQKMFGAGSALRMAVAGAVGGAAGQEGADSAPVPYKPLADLAGNLIGGGITAGIGTAADAAIPASGRAAVNLVRPFTQSGRKTLAAQRIAGAASDLPNVRATLEETAASPDHGQIVPGSQPTTFQLTGDQGLGNLERATAKENPDLFLQRAAQQNAARVGQLDSQVPADADPAAVGAAFRGQLADLDAQSQAWQAQQLQRAQQETAGLGSPVPVGADQQASALQRLGQPIRSSLQAADDAAKARTTALFNAIDPDGTLSVSMSGVRQSAQDIMRSRPQNAAPLSGETQAIFGTAAMQPVQQSFRELSALRSRVTDQLRATRVDPAMAQDNRLLTQLLASIDATLSGAVEGKAAQEVSAVQQSAMSPLDTLAAKLGGDVKSWYANRSFAQAEPAAGLSGRGYNQSASGRGSSAGVGLPRTAGKAARRLSRNEGTESLQNEPGDLNPFDQAAAARYAAARASHAERKSTFANAPGVGAVLKPGPVSGEYALADSSVPAAIFTSGKEAAERMQAYRRAGGNMNAVADYAAFDLRRAAEKEDGTIDPAKYEKWMAAHREAMGVLPDLAKRFASAAEARRTLDEAAAQHAAAVKQFEKSAAARFMGDHDPVAVVGRILRASDGAATMRELARRTAGNAAAREGLQKAVIEHILNDLRSNAMAGDTEIRQMKADTFQTFLRKATPALQQIFNPQQVKAIENVALDIQRTQRSVLGTKLPGGSNTAQDLAAGIKHGSNHGSPVSILAWMESLGEGLHYIAGPLGKVVGIVLAPLRDAAQAKGMAKVDDLVTEAMLHPELARALLAKVPPGGFGKSVVANAVRQIGAVAAASSARSAMSGDKQ